MVDSVTTGLAVAEDRSGAPHAAPALAPLSFRQMSLFSTGDMVAGVIDTAVGTFLLFYLTAVVGLSGTLAGLALFLSLAVDAVADPLIGYLSDNSQSRFGRRHPMMLVSLLPLAFGVAMLFGVPAIRSPVGLFVVITLTLFCVRIAASGFTLPFIAMGAEISRDYRERSLLGAYRTFFNIIGNVLIIVLGFSVFMTGEDGLTNRAAYGGFGMACALIALAAGLVCAIGTLSMRGRMHAADPAAAASPRQFLLEIGEVARNPSFRVLFLTVLIFWVAQGVAGTMALHMSRYFWRLPAAVIQLIPISVAVGVATGIFVAAMLLRRFEKQQVCVVGLGLFCALQIIPVVLRLTGVLTAQGPALYLILYGIAFITGWTMTSVGIAFGSMMADTADEHEWLYGSRREGLYFAGLTFSAKAAIAVGALIGGAALDLTGFTHALATLGPNPTMPAEITGRLGLIAGPGSGLISAVSVVALVFYRLDAAKHARIQSEIAARKV